MLPDFSLCDCRQEDRMEVEKGQLSPQHRSLHSSSSKGPGGTGERDTMCVGANYWPTPAHMQIQSTPPYPRSSVPHLTPLLFEQIVPGPPGMHTECPSFTSRASS